MKFPLSNAGHRRPLGLAAMFLLLTVGCKESPWLVKENPTESLYDLRGSGVSASDLANRSNAILARQSELTKKK